MLASALQAQLAKHRASGDTVLLMGWMRLHALLYACEPEVRRLVRRSVNDWLAHRGDLCYILD